MGLEVSHHKVLSLTHTWAVNIPKVNFDNMHPYLSTAKNLEEQLKVAVRW
jgi:hypothetical protein